MHLLRRAVAGVVVALVLAPTSAATSSTTEAAPARATADEESRQAVIAAYVGDLLPALDVPIGWTGSVSGCREGAPSAAAQQATLDTLNYLRALAGLDEVTLDPSMSARAQKAALMMQAENALSHSPPSTWACYSADGARAAGQSNLYLGRTGADAMVGFMQDPGAGNTAVGHRRWILEPTTRAFGVGSTSRANALAVFGGPAGSTDENATRPTFIEWPVAGYFPAPLEPDGRWSLSASGPDVSFDDASVSMTGPNGVVSTRLEKIVDGFGPHTLVWQTGALAVPTPMQDTTYTVTVSGVRDGDTLLPAHVYDVTLVDPAQATFELETAPVLLGTPRVGEPLGVDPGQWTPQPTGFHFRWLRDGVAVTTGGTSSSYLPGAVDLGATLSVRVVPTGQDHVSSGVTIVAATPVQEGRAAIVVDKPQITGTARVADRLQVSTGTWRPRVTSYTYQWQRGTVPIAGATRNRYRPTKADRGKRLRVVVGAVRAGHAAARVTTARTAVIRR